MCGGCYLSHGPDEGVPPSACVEADATLAYVEGTTGCVEIEVGMREELECFHEPAAGGRGERGFEYPRWWRRVRYVNATERAVVASFEPFAERCRVEGEARFASMTVTEACACGSGGGSAGTGPVHGGGSTRSIAPGSELQMVFAGAEARVVMRMCDEPGI